MNHKVQVWVIRSLREGTAEALLLKTTPERGAFWQPVTGSVEDRETLASAAIRELKEETGFSINGSDLYPINAGFEFESRWGGRVREEVFLALIEKLDTVTLDPSEHVDFKWVDLRQAESFLHHESTKICLKNVTDFVVRNFSFYRIDTV